MAIESIWDQWKRAVALGSLMSREEKKAEKKRARLKARAKLECYPLHPQEILISFNELFRGEGRLEVFDRLNRYPNLVESMKTATLIRRNGKIADEEHFVVPVVIEAIDKESVLA